MILSDGLIVSSPIKLLTNPRAVYGKPEKDENGKVVTPIVGAYFIYNGSKLYYDDPAQALQIRAEIAEKLPEAQLPQSISDTEKRLGELEEPEQ